ncbi:39S ribosomal protein L30, mitochondrial [Anopheles marshallii]|uniref:39S ribosomal protein L30, mitochondrial n=1 Tax=Anopheles marshallii TaxID=1521116 RepID=UPI00237A8B3E|nr:39S ribosomal protein L30, mitochondrial [Anopheles marshallii]
MLKVFQNSTLLAQQLKGLASVRYYGKPNKKFLYKDGILKDQIYYYPRDGNREIPALEGEPSKLFSVRRLKPIKGLPHWEKRILRGLGLYEKNAVAVVKNIPENNARLWKVKHLVEILPITYKYGEPTQDDIERTFLKEDGECVVIRKLEAIEVANSKITAAEQIRNAKERMDGETLRKDSRLKWLNAW